jgi:UDP-N-acetylmuramyl pentapeptide phosphotransferase/UDP-N-acetylglucosamine-1-phosphate transferase
MDILSILLIVLILILGFLWWSFESEKVFDAFDFVKKDIDKK